jgi:5-carboxymethyl-2-hydroxymuconate isomerase
MPHCILEYSANVRDSIDFKRFFSELHRLLAASGEIDLERLKSRAVRREEYLIGDGKPENAFAYLQISMLSGRSSEVRKRLGEDALKLLAGYYSRSQEQLNCSLTVEIREMDRSTHFAAPKR